MAQEMGPREWLRILGRKLMERRLRVHRWQRYYDGDMDLPTGAQQHKDAYKTFQKKARTNLCKLCVDSMVHRMQVIGYNSGEESRTDNDIWKLWQQSRLDSRQFDLYRRALISGSAYAVVSTDANRQNRPLVTIESAKNVCIATDPGDPTRRLAALRLWYDEYEQRWMATVFLPGSRHAYITAAKHPTEDSAQSLDWSDKSWVTRLDPAKSFDEVPVIEFPNGSEGEEPRAEFDVAMDIQDRMNLTLLNRMTADRYAAFRQRFLLNYEPEYDEVTGLPMNPFKSAADSLFMVPPPGPGMPEPRFGDLVQTDTANMLRAVDADMKAFAAVSITPVYYLPGDLINISAEGIAALDAGHTAKIKERSSSWSESWEEVLALAAQIAGVSRELHSSEVVWARPENFDLSSIADYAAKLRNAGYPLPIIAAKLGDSPQEIERLRTEMAADAAREALAQPDTGDDTAGGRTNRQQPPRAS